MSVVDAFPRRPLKLRRLQSGRLGLWQWIALLLFTGGMVFNAIYIVPSIYDDAVLGRSGTPALEARLGEGGKCSRRLLVRCSFDVIYQTADRTSHRVSLQYLATFESVDTSTRLTAVYDPAKPDRISPNWGRELLTNRIVTNAVLVALFLSIIVFFAMNHRTSVQTQRSLEKMAKEPRAVVAKFMRNMASKRFATVFFSWADPATGAVRKGYSRFPHNLQPFWLDREHTTMLALAGPDGRAHLLDQELSLVELTDEEERRIRAAAAAISAAA